VAGSDSVAGSVAGSDWAEESSVSPSSSPSSPIRAISAPMSTVSSSSTRILVRTPATGDGISVSTLSVETSRSGSSTSTVSPTFFNHWVTVPSVTLSPRSGMETDVGMVPHWIWARYLPEVCPGSADVTGAGRWARPWGGRAVVDGQRFARQSKVCLAQCFRLARVWVNELRDLRGQRLPVVDQLPLGDEFADTCADHVDAQHRAVLFTDDLHSTLRLQDLALAVACQVVVHLVDLVATLLGLLRGHADRCHLGLAVSDTGHAVVVDHRRVLPGDVFGDEDALGEADMGQLQGRDQVTDRIDVADTGVQILVDLHETTVERDALLFVTKPLGDRTTADGDQENFRLQDLATLEGDRDAGVGVFDRFERYTELGLDLAPPEGPLQQLGTGLVLQGKKAVEGLHEGHVRAVGTPHTGELHADHTATQDDGGTGHAVQIHGLVTGDDLLTVDLQAQGLGLGTRGEQDVTALVDSAVDG